MIRFWAIASNTFLQTLRQNAFLILTGLVVLMLILSVPLTGWTMGATGGDYRTTDQRMLEDNGLTTFAASSVIGKEIENGTALTVLSKPVARATFVLAKFAGVAAAVSVAFYICAIAYLMTVRHGVLSAAVQEIDWPVVTLGILAVAMSLFLAAAGNYMFGWTFASTMVYSLVAALTVVIFALGFIGKGWTPVPFGGDVTEYGQVVWPYRPQVFSSLALIYLAVLVLVSIAVAVSSRFGQIATILMTLAVLLVGSMYAPLFGRYGQLGPIRALGWVFPKLPFFYKLNAMSTDTPIPFAYVGISAIYAGLYIAGILCVALAMFQTRQVDIRTTSSTMPGTVTMLTRLGQAAALLIALVGVPAVIWTLETLGATAIGLLIAAETAAIIAFYVWTLFGRGVRWTWYAMLTGHTVLATVLIYLGVDRLSKGAGVRDAGLAEGALALAVVNLVVVAMLLGSETRHHFSSSQAKPLRDSGGI
jgi:hypothetical protein